MVKLTVYGYRLGERNEVEFLPFKRCLLLPETPGKAVEYLRPTMANLLEYLLAHAVGEIVPDKTLQIQVWENNGLSCSSQRLWQVMHNLKNKLALVGLPDNFIMRITGKGYMIANEMVMELYCKRRQFSKNGAEYPLQRTKTFESSMSKMIE